MAGTFARKSLSLMIASLCGVSAMTCAATPNSAGDSGTIGVSNPIYIGNVDAILNEALPAPVVKVLKSSAALKVVTKKQIKFTGPTTGSAMALKVAPGVEVAGYGVTGATKNSLTINGLKQGWGGAAGAGIDDGSISVTFDGLPMVDPATGLWQSPLIPQMFMIQNVGITYGPGQAVDRWYNNIGGQIAFNPVQPSKHSGGKVQLTYGSYNNKNLALVLQGGQHDGWSTVLAGGFGSSDGYRKSIGGFKNPSYDFAWFLKTRKTFANGDLSLGAYTAKGVGYRPNYIPVNPISGIDVNGLNAGGELYSEKTSGYYSALPYDLWHKQDTNQVAMYYIKFNEALDRQTTFHNDTWYRMAKRLHVHYYNYPLGAPSSNKHLYEYNNPHNDMYGDKAWLDINLPYNLISVGGWFLRDVYNSRNAFYSSVGTQAVPDGHYRSDYFYSNYLAAFVQDEIHPVRSLHITPGIRFINYHISYVPAAQQDFATAYSLYPANNQATLPPATSSFQKVEPSLGVNWRAMKHMTLFAYYGVAYREPSNGGGGGPFQSVPAYALKLEKGTNYQLGAKWHYDHAPLLNHFLASINYFYTRYTGQYIPITSQNGTYLSTAQGSSHYDGVDFYLNDEPVNNIYAFLNGTIEQAKFDNYVNGNLNYNGRWVSQVPNYTLNVGAYYKILHQDVMYEPRIWYSEIGTQHIWDNNIGAPSNQTLPSYGLLNLGFDVDIPTHFMGAHVFKVSLSVLNALDKKYNVYEYISSGGYFGGNSQGALLAYPGAPTTADLSVTADF